MPLGRARGDAGGGRPGPGQDGEEALAVSLAAVADRAGGEELEYLVEAAGEATRLPADWLDRLADRAAIEAEARALAELVSRI